MKDNRTKKGTKEVFAFGRRTLPIIIICLFCVCIEKTYSRPRNIAKIFLNIYLEEATTKDTLTISVGDNILSTIAGFGDGDSRRKFKNVKNTKGYFRFEIPVNQKSGYFTLSKNRRLGEVAFDNVIIMMEPQLWESGDSLTAYLQFKETNLGGGASGHFSGPGSMKYNLINELNGLKLSLKDNEIIPVIWPLEWDGNILNYDKFDLLPSITKERLRHLDKYKEKLTSESHYIIKTDLIYGGRSGWFTKISNFALSKNFKDLGLASKNAFLDRFNTSFDSKNNYGISQKYLAKSIRFCTFLLNKIKCASDLYVGHYSPEWVYWAIKNYNIGLTVKELLVMRHFTHSTRYAENPDVYFKDARKHLVRSPDYVKILDELVHQSPGTLFSKFAMEDANGNIKTLKDFKNKVVLLDFWFTGCGHCEVLYRDILVKAKEKFRDNSEVVFVSISIDKDKKVWKNSISGGTYTSVDAINLYTGGLKDQHPLIRFYKISGYPSLILLDKNSRIKWFNTPSLHNEILLIKSIKSLL